MLFTYFKHIFILSLFGLFHQSSFRIYHVCFYYYWVSWWRLCWVLFRTVQDLLRNRKVSPGIKISSCATRSSNVKYHTVPRVSFHLFLEHSTLVSSYWLVLFLQTFPTVLSSFILSSFILIHSTFRCRPLCTSASILAHISAHHFFCSNTLNTTT